MVTVEAADVLCALAERGIAVLVQQRDGQPVAEFDGTEAQLDGMEHAYLGAPGSSTVNLGPSNKNPGKHGWVTFYLPRRTPSVLYMAELGLSTASVDEEGPYDNPDGLRTFGRIVRHLRPRLARPTWAWHIAQEGATAYRDVGFTAGALHLANEGVEWMQWGVANIRYGPRAPSG